MAFPVTMNMFSAIEDEGVDNIFSKLKIKTPKQYP